MNIFGQIGRIAERMLCQLQCVLPRPAGSYALPNLSHPSVKGIAVGSTEVPKNLIAALPDAGLIVDQTSCERALCILDSVMVTVHGSDTAA